MIGMDKNHVRHGLQYSYSVHIPRKFVPDALDGPTGRSPAYEGHSRSTEHPRVARNEKAYDEEALWSLALMSCVEAY